MTRKEKRAFIRNLTRSVAQHVASAVNRMPENWDGHELRRMLAEQFAREAYGEFRVSLRHRPYALSGRRLRDYTNERLVRNLP